MTATPIDLIESYFNIELNKRSIKGLAKKPKQTWVEFARYYREPMGHSFAHEFLDEAGQANQQMRLFFEPTMKESWDRVATHLFGVASPLIGMSPYLQEDIDSDTAARILRPLIKHLLIADSVYIRDAFYCCFDPLNDYPLGSHWQQNPSTQEAFVDYIEILKAWLPLLVELRPLIDSRALVFVPYWLTPSFPYTNYTSDKLNELHLGIRRLPYQHRKLTLRMASDARADACSTCWDARLSRPYDCQSPGCSGSRPAGIDGRQPERRSFPPVRTRPRRRSANHSTSGTTPGKPPRYAGRVLDSQVYRYVLIQF